MATDLAAQNANSGSGPDREAILEGLLHEARAEIEAQKRRADAAEVIAIETVRRWSRKTQGAPADDKLRWLLRIVSAAGGSMDSSDAPCSPLAAFTNDDPDTDTLNRAIERRLLIWSHDSDSDTSTVRLSSLGAEYLKSNQVVDAGLKGWRRMTAEQLRSLPSNGTFPALVRFEVGEWAGHIGLPCDPWSMDPQDIAEALWLPVDEAVGRPSIHPQGIYIASKSVHGPRWRALRDRGVPVISTWIDESEVGATYDWPDLWSRCIVEAASCSTLIVYREPDEILKGAWVEVGAALSAGRHVIAIGCQDFTVRNHPRFHLVDNLDDALEMARELGRDTDGQFPAPLVSSEQLRRDLARALTSYGGRLNADNSFGGDTGVWETFLHEADVAIRIVTEACSRIAGNHATSSDVAARISERMRALIHSESGS